MRATAIAAEPGWAWRLIAHQLSLALEAELALSNREGGGLEARLSLPAAICEA